jgi:molybdopterin-guanine dinucleotide biosynthesis protein A
MLVQANGAIDPVLACDLVDASPEGVRRVLDALAGAPDAQVAVPVVDGRPEPLHSAWRPSAVEAVDLALDAGERAVHAVIGRLPVVEVHDLDRSWFRNVNSPEQLGHT